MTGVKRLGWYSAAVSSITGYYYIILNNVQLLILKLKTQKLKDITHENDREAMMAAGPSDDSYLFHGRTSDDLDVLRAELLLQQDMELLEDLLDVILRKRRGNHVKCVTKNIQSSQTRSAKNVES